jgi:hypothetical protein
MDQNTSNRKTENKEVLYIFFIYPFAAFLLALNNLKKKYSFFVLLLFFTLFGLTFIAKNSNIDSYRYIEEFNLNKNITTHQYISNLKDYFTLKSNIKDIYSISSYYFVSRISDNYHLLMGIWAFIFSYFSLKSFRFFVETQEFKKSLTVALLAFLFIYSNNIFNINGVRFYTAAWMAVFSVFEIVLNKNYKFLVLALLTPLIHISYIIFVCILLLYLISQKYDKFWIIIFIISFFISEISLELIHSFQDTTPKIIQNIIWSYSSESNVQNRIYDFEHLPLYARIFNSLPRYYINLLMFLLILNRRQINLIPRVHSIFVFLLIWLASSNFTMAIPSLGARFITLSVPLITYLCLLVYSKIHILSKIIYLIPIVYSYSILYWVKYMIMVTDPILLISVFPHILIKNLY